MDELIGQVTSIARGVWKHRWPGLIVAWWSPSWASRWYFRAGSLRGQRILWTPVHLKPLMSAWRSSRTSSSRCRCWPHAHQPPERRKLVRMADLVSNQVQGSKSPPIDELKISSAGRQPVRSVVRDPSPIRPSGWSVAGNHLRRVQPGRRPQDSVTAEISDEQIKAYEASKAETRLKDRLRTSNFKRRMARTWPVVCQIAVCQAQLIA